MAPKMRKKLECTTVKVPKQTNLTSNLTSEIDLFRKTGTLSKNINLVLEA